MSRQLQYLKSHLHDAITTQTCKLPSPRRRGLTMEMTGLRAFSAFTLINPADGTPTPLSTCVTCVSTARPGAFNCSRVMWLLFNLAEHTSEPFFPVITAEVRHFVDNLGI